MTRRLTKLTGYHAICQKIVEGRLLPQPNLLAWLQDAGVPYEDLTFEAVQQHRMDWLDQLIVEYGGTP